MTGKQANLSEDALPPPNGERFDTLLTHRHVVIERIVSSSHITPTQCVQDQDEWVVLLKGEATLSVAGQTATLKAGDHLFLPARTPHTVEKVSQGAMWLAVHIHSEPQKKIP